MKILLVDDDTELSNILASRLKRRGFEISQASSFDQAKEVFDAQAGAFRAVLCDYHIGQGTGLDVFDYVAGRSFSGTFVFMSGDDISCQRVLSLSADGKCQQLLKPFEMDALLALLAK